MYSDKQEKSFLFCLHKIDINKYVIFVFLSMNNVIEVWHHLLSQVQQQMQMKN